LFAEKLNTWQNARYVIFEFSVLTSMPRLYIKLFK
jgi:hypothetical protein